MIEPLQIIEESDNTISIKWSDDTQTEYTAPQLRRLCPCATCVNEWTGEKMLRDESVADDLKAIRLNLRRVRAPQSSRFFTTLMLPLVSSSASSSPNAAW